MGMVIVGEYQCPKCGSWDTLKQGGGRIKCHACHKSSMIIYIGKPILDFSDRPPCPNCGEYEGRWKSKYTRRLVCGNCGTQYSVGADLPEIKPPDLTVEAV